MALWGRHVADLAQAIGEASAIDRQTLIDASNNRSNYARTRAVVGDLQSEALDLLSLKAGRNNLHFHLLTCGFPDAHSRSLWI